ncbi:hypothetical protein OIDMADRAFT_17320 [Oidiodendron maius Zn]|uniref:Uncharacterized protein n=1 Tax=Oidiodendron maius (strain Zn) TaxID=913774 RepID=A0A0C3HW12_OIDMZ|nr:hypothetical protein OIDMADRAFT_17320 [Oidiodendron maius Zn]
MALRSGILQHSQLDIFQSENLQSLEALHTDYRHRRSPSAQNLGIPVKTPAVFTRLIT